MASPDATPWWAGPSPAPRQGEGRWTLRESGGFLIGPTRLGWGVTGAVLEEP